MAAHYYFIRLFVSSLSLSSSSDVVKVVVLLRVCVFNKSNRVYVWYIKCNNGEREREESEREMISQVVK